MQTFGRNNSRFTSFHPIGGSLSCSAPAVWFSTGRGHFFTKEPETVDWIRTFNAQETLFDVGANVGVVFPAGGEGWC